MAGKARPTVRDIAAEIVRRSLIGVSQEHEPEACFLFVSDPPTPQERLAVMAARLRVMDVAVFPRHEMTEAEWVARYCAGEVN